MNIENLELSADELTELAYAKGLLENPGFAASLADRIGKPVEGSLNLLPDGWN